MERAMKGLYWGLIVFLSALFGYAGVVKVLAPGEFLSDILSYRILPYPLAQLAAFLIPALECVCAVSIYFTRWRRAAVWWLLLLMLAFSISLLSAWIRGLDISCGCFGQSHASANYPVFLLRDLGLICACVVILWLEASTKKDVGLESPTP